MLSEKEKKEELEWKIIKTIFGSIGIVFCSAALYFIGDNLIHPKNYKTFEMVYTPALKQYADTNKDGFVSTIEKDAFDKDLLKDKDVNLIVGQRPKYNKNGN
ncbi:MAG: hypothetical protein KKA65_05180, partial [Nanoarchaeota archaeon]|nr:hypothetical protein [Nanoarchaeota archaeon]MBU4456867.1 hypothetical protein [Nanoarchaeota archaeon]MCG2719560.1 hypothetical protein [Nanoarchaeota archaeon]